MQFSVWGHTIKMVHSTLLFGMLGGMLWGCSNSHSGDGALLDTSVNDSDSLSQNDSETDPARIELRNQTIALRGDLSVPKSSDRLNQQELMAQLPQFDPGSLLRCGLNDNDNYRATVAQLGGVRWNYSVSMLQDNSKPIFQKGLPEQSWLDNTNAEVSEDAGGVEIVEADIVGLSEEAALFASAAHGLLLADLSQETPQFVCAAKLPGIAKKFYYYQNRLVVMVEGIVPEVRNHSYLLHFEVGSRDLTFIEAVDLGVAQILDSRRFNERLVIYTDMVIPGELDTETGATIDGTTSEIADAPVAYWYNSPHRQMHVFKWADTLVAEMSETQISNEEDIQWVEITPETHAAGDLVYQSSSFSDSIWASNRYFVTTESIHQSYLEGFENRSYNRCIEHHTVEVPYTNCHTVYETRPNPNYEPPDNTGGDRNCTGTTLADCLRHVATVSNETIQVPVDRICEQRTRTHYICDKSEVVQYTVPQYERKTTSKLTIYEYTTDGFVRFASDVAEIQGAGLSEVTLSDGVDSLTTSIEKVDLQINGNVQTLYFQQGFMYVIAEGVLQVYAMGDNSLVRTATLNVVNDTLQTSLFTDDTIYLSDFSWNYGSGDTSQLKLVNLSNPAFPTLTAQTQELPGGHSNILAINEGIFTIGRVSKFEGQSVQWLKLGLFGDPDATELSYLILGTDLSNNSIAQDNAFYFDYGANRLFLPYHGFDPSAFATINRLGISHVENAVIASEGALETPEFLQRVRPEPGSDRYMGFGDNSIQSLVNGVDGWEMRPLLEYYTPIALYRYTDADDYVEVLRLGNQCRFHFTKDEQINTRDDDSMSAPFFCTGARPMAYEQNIIFGDRLGFAFAANGTFTPLTAKQVDTYYEAVQTRPYCLLSTTDRFRDVNNLRIDFATSSYSMDDFTCMSSEEYNALLYNDDAVD